MSAPLVAIGWALAGLAGAGIGYTGVAGLLVQRFFHDAGRGPGEAASGEGATVLKPLHRAEPGLDRRLEDVFVQADDDPFQIVFGSDRADDPALEIARALAETYPERAVLIAANPKIHGQNRKVSNIINMMNQLETQAQWRVSQSDTIIVLSDSDIGVGPDYLRRIRQALAAPGVGVVTCPYFGAAEAGFWSGHVAMGISYQFLPSVVVGAMSGAAQPCMGSTIALRRTTLERIGGFDAFRDILADDYAIGAAVRDLGLTSVVAPVLVSHCCSEATFKGLMAHELRWARTVMGVQPAGYLGSIVTHPLPLALLATLSLGFSAASLSLVAAAFAARVWLMSRVDQAIGRRLGPWWLTPMRDMLSFVVFVGAFFVGSVAWRGVKYRVTTNGDLKPV